MVKEVALAASMFCRSTDNSDTLHGYAQNLASSNAKLILGGVGARNRGFAIAYLPLTHILMSLPRARAGLEEALI